MHLGCVACTRVGTAAAVTALLDISGYRSIGLSIKDVSARRALSRDPKFRNYVDGGGRKASAASWPQSSMPGA